MNIFNVFALMVVGWVIVEVVKVWRGKTSSHDESDSMTDLFGCEWDESGKVKALKNEVASLRERIETLEAIVTDEKYQLNKEIDKL